MHLLAPIPTLLWVPGLASWNSIRAPQVSVPDRPVADFLGLEAGSPRSRHLQGLVPPGAARGSLLQAALSDLQTAIRVHVAFSLYAAAPS